MHFAWQQKSRFGLDAPWCSFRVLDKFQTKNCCDPAGRFEIQSGPVHELRDRCLSHATDLGQRKLRDTGSRDRRPKNANKVLAVGLDQSQPRSVTQRHGHSLGSFFGGVFRHFPIIANAIEITTIAFTITTNGERVSTSER